MTAAYTAIVIHPSEDGVIRVERVTSEAGDDHFLSKKVGGYIEHLSTPGGKVDFWMNENGKLDRMPVNALATDVLYMLHPAFRGHDILVGPVVLTGNNGEDTASIPEGLWEHLKSFSWAAKVEFTEVEP